MPTDERKTCPECHRAFDLHEAQISVSGGQFTIGGQSFDATVRQVRCPHCGAEYNLVDAPGASEKPVRDPRLQRPI